MDAINSKERSQNPRANANIFEILTFSWIINLFKTGQKRDLDEKDLFETLKDDKASLLGNELEMRWRIKINNNKSANKKSSLLIVLIQMFGVNLMFLGLIQGVIELILKMSQPMLIGGLLSNLKPQESNSKEFGNAYVYASGLMLNILVTIAFHRYSLFEMLHCGMRIRVACCSLIFKKALKLNKNTLGKTTVGQVVNLLSNDVRRFDIAPMYLHTLWVGPVQTIIVTYLLWLEIGMPSFFGIVLFILFIPLQGWLGKKTSQFRLSTAPCTDERVKLINEIISGIRVIKMYTWEKPFTYLVQIARKLEIQQIRGATFIKIISQCFTIFQIRFVLCMCIIIYMLLGNNINATKVFVTISYLNMLTSTMTSSLPRGMGLIAETLVSIERIQNFLLYDEKHEPEAMYLTQKNFKSDKNTSTVDNEEIITSNIDNLNEKFVDKGIIISNATAKWTSNQSENCLNNINLAVKPGQLVAIVGPVGAGKSSLIQAILHELTLTKGNISMCGLVSYVSQEPWIFGGSLRKNILFGSQMDEERYKEVLKVCALKTDLEQLPYGDRTIVGERGALLSGGQKARIHLARAVYKQADIYLLDDPLSAVDSHVSKHLFEKCIKGYLKEKACILTTHQIQYLNKVDSIFLMKNGNVIAEGSYQKLQSSDENYTNLLGFPDEKIVTSNIESCDHDASTNSLDHIPILSRQNSCKSTSSSIDESKFKGGQTSPVEVAEIRSFGRVSRKVYSYYISAGGSYYRTSLLFFVCIFVQIVATSVDYWISYWVNLEEHTFHNSNVLTHNSSSTLTNTIDEPLNTLLWWSISRQTCVIVYAVLNLTLVTAVLIRCILLVNFYMTVSLNVHSNMFNSIVGAKLYFFNTHSSGRILNHFTGDMGDVDDMLPIFLTNFIDVVLSLTGVIVVIGFTKIYLIIPAFVIGIFAFYIVECYLSTSRSVSRLERVSRSPVYAHLNACLQGLSTIRAFKTENILCSEFDDLQDLHSSAWYLSLASGEAVGFALDVVCLSYIGLLIYSFLIIGNGTYVGSIGLVITQSIRLTKVLQWGVKLLAGLENQMTSVERILEFTNIPQETVLETSSYKELSKEWPSKGKIVFKNLSLSYSPETSPVLNGINITIQPMEKVGIVGRTGAGKSSLIEALFRLAFNEGSIWIDDKEIHDLRLQDLRSKMSIIPQDPVLFSGTIRKNLDPIGIYPDHRLWEVLDEVQLKNVVNNLFDGLNSKVSEGQTNFSFGQRQLLCLARAILQNNKILVLDEATANVDPETDALIQNTIRNKFRTCTVLTIAHRLNTVMDSDRILVIDAGLVVEFDHPHNLLKNKNGHLYKLVAQTGQNNANKLHNIAEQGFNTINK